MRAALSRRFAITHRVLFLSSLVPTLVVGCGPSATPKSTERPDVIITLDGKRHACIVALDKEPQGSAVPCKEVVSFLHDQLRVNSGSIYDIRTIPKVDDAEIASVAAALNGAGYRFIGGRNLP